MDKKRRFLSLIVLVVVLFVAETFGAAHTYSVSFDWTSNKWKLDSTVAPELTLASEIQYAFDVASTTPNVVFFLSTNDNPNSTAGALGTADGAVNNACTPPCTITYTPLAGDVSQTFYYLAENLHDTGSTILITSCTAPATETECGQIAGCGWTTSCLKCSSLTSSNCSSAPTCGWCLDDSGLCLASDDDSCALFQASSSESSTGLYYLFFLLVIPVAAAAIALIVLVNNKAAVAKQNSAMFKIEDEMSVLGGRPTLDDNTL